MERLQKVMAAAGVGSRRKCEELIRQGRVRVDGAVATLGCKVDRGKAEITVDGRVLPLGEGKRYIVLHKPAGILTVMVDDRGRPALSSLVPVAERLYPVGRLDLNSEGLLLLTNDGELAHRLTHPRYSHPKEYTVLVEGQPDDAALAALNRGVIVRGKRTRPARVQRMAGPPGDPVSPFTAFPESSTWLHVTLQEGRKRQIRRMCAVVGHPVLRLVRVSIGPLRLGQLRAGQWRDLTPSEVRTLALDAGTRKQGS